MRYKNKRVYICALLLELAFFAQQLNSFEGEEKSISNKCVYHETQGLTLEIKEKYNLKRKNPVEYFTKEHPHLLEKAVNNLSNLSLFLIKDDDGNIDYTDNRN